MGIVPTCAATETQTIAQTGRSKLAQRVVGL